MEGWVQVEIERRLYVGEGFAFGMTSGIDVVAATVQRSPPVPFELRASEVAAQATFVNIDIPSAATVANAVFAVEEVGEEATWLRWHEMWSIASWFYYT